MRIKKIAALALTVAAALSAPGAMALQPDQTVSSMVAAMTLRQKLGQMTMLSIRQWDGAEVTGLTPGIAQMVSDYQPGGIILFAGNTVSAGQTARLTDGLQKSVLQSCGIPLLIGIDQEGGIVARLRDGTSLPGNMALGASGSADNASKAGAVIGGELAALGININFAPDLDVNDNPRNPVINLRSFGGDPSMASRLGPAMIRGIQSKGVIAAGKHFPGHGNTSTDSHTGLPMVDRSLAELRQVELKPFQAAIDSGADVIMTAHIQYPQIENRTFTSRYDGGEVILPATLSPEIVTGLLREQMGFHGVVVTDALNMGAISQNFGSSTAAKMAIQAGIDLLLMPVMIQGGADLPELEAYFQDLEAAVMNGEIPESSIDTSVARILALKEKHGVFDVLSDTRSADEKAAAAQKTVGSAEHRKTERELAAAGVTLLKEEHPLPFRPKPGSSLLLMAPYDNELPGMEYGVNRLVNEGLLPDVEVQTYCYFGETSLSGELLQLLDNADTVVCCTEMGDESDLAPWAWPTALPEAVRRYLAGSPTSFAMVSVGEPYDAAAHPKASVFLAAYGYLGMDPTEAKNPDGPRLGFGPNIPAAIDILFGKFQPVGTLPVEIPDLDDTGSMAAGPEAYPLGAGIVKTAVSPAESKSSPSASSVPPSSRQASSSETSSDVSSDGPSDDAAPGRQTSILASPILYFGAAGALAVVLAVIIFAAKKPRGKKRRRY